PLSGLPAYSTVLRGSLTNATGLDISEETPEAGTGIFYLVKVSSPPCGSWQSGVGSEPARDTMILPACSGMNVTADQVGAAVDSSWSDDIDWNLLLSRVQVQLGCALDVAAHA